MEALVALSSIFSMGCWQHPHYDTSHAVLSNRVLACFVVAGECWVEIIFLFDTINTVIIFFGFYIENSILVSVLGIFAGN